MKGGRGWDVGRQQDPIGAGEALWSRKARLARLSKGIETVSQQVSSEAGWQRLADGCSGSFFFLRRQARFLANDAGSRNQARPS